MKTKGFYRRNLPHIKTFSGAYFVTFRVKGDLFLPARARSITLRHCLFENQMRIDLFAVVIMPNHVHMIFESLEDDDGEPYALAVIMKGIKGTSARNINRFLGRAGTLWMPESFDRILRRGEFEKKLNYIRANPVDAGLCSRPEEYKWLWENAQARVPALHRSSLDNQR
ncbi:MAG TPA: transposase [Candidatus Angelobacter sp.]|jgi:putative transposase|nr:transposase [Candidatus Angelobacter sp.]